MAEATKIEWADSTANLWIGCTKVSPGCDHCYAEADFDLRKHRVQWGPHGDRSYCKAGWALIRKMQRAAANNGGVDPELGRRRRIFVNSLSDFFDNHRSITWRDEAWSLIRECPDVIFMLLTKRPQNIREMLPADWVDGYPNVWLGTTVENQEEADRRIPHLLATPAAVRWLSCEPLLGPVDLKNLRRYNPTGKPWINALNGLVTRGDYLARSPDECCFNTSTKIPGELPKLDWIVAGGESGPGARPMHPEWARSLRDQCAATGVPFFFKQWGEWAPKDSPVDWPYDKDYDRLHWWDRRSCVRPIESGWDDRYKDGLGAFPPPPFDLFKTPEYLDQVARCEKGCGERAGKCLGNKLVASICLGKKAAGRLLDGVEHNGVPA